MFVLQIFKDLFTYLFVPLKGRVTEGNITDRDLPSSGELLGKLKLPGPGQAEIRSFIWVSAVGHTCLHHLQVSFQVQSVGARWEAEQPVLEPALQYGMQVSQVNTEYGHSAGTPEYDYREKGTVTHLSGQMIFMNAYPVHISAF